MNKKISDSITEYMLSEGYDSMYIDECLQGMNDRELSETENTINEICDDMSRMRGYMKSLHEGNDPTRREHQLTGFGEFSIVVYSHKCT